MTMTPDCELDVHISCRTAEVVVKGIVIVKARRCDCPCHTKRSHRARSPLQDLSPKPIG
ncbi:hypothetical protein ACIQUL_08975 [Streptomyces sp. NPDC090303]|uniref:hypothetical protein n=1 Tax=Streptomyces sp. NPDC090303 TaxID=3365960 RepID=UPI0038215C60